MFLFIFPFAFLRERERENEDSVLEGYGGGENLGGVGRGETEIRTYCKKKFVFNKNVYGKSVCVYALVCVRIHMHASMRIAFMVNDDKIYPHLQWLLQSPEV